MRPIVLARLAGHVTEELRASAASVVVTGPDVPAAVAECAGSPFVVAAGEEWHCAAVAGAVAVGDQDPVVGIAPIDGSGLMRMFGLPAPADPLRHLCGESEYRIDIGSAEGEWGRTWFLSAVAIGTAARRRGSLSPASSILRRAPTISIRTERRSVEARSHAVVVANAQFWGKTNPAPRATVVDGRLDIQLIEGGPMRLAATARRMMRGTHLHRVQRTSAASVEIRSSRPLAVATDGKVAGYGPVAISVRPKAIALSI